MFRAMKHRRGTRVAAAMAAVALAGAGGGVRGGAGRLRSRRHAAGQPGESGDPSDGVGRWVADGADRRCGVVADRRRQPRVRGRQLRQRAPRRLGGRRGQRAAGEPARVRHHDRCARHLVRARAQRAGPRGRRVDRRGARVRRRRLHHRRRPEPQPHRRVRRVDGRARRHVRAEHRLPRLRDRRDADRRLRRRQLPGRRHRHAQLPRRVPRLRRRAPRLGPGRGRRHGERARDLARRVEGRGRWTVHVAQRLDQPGIRPRLRRRGHRYRCCRRRRTAPCATAARTPASPASPRTATGSTAPATPTAAAACSRARSRRRGRTAPSTGSRTATATRTRRSCRPTPCTSSGTRTTAATSAASRRATRGTSDAALAFSTTRTGTITKEPYGYFNWEGTPSPSPLTWYPEIEAGTYTGQSQGPWSVTGNGQYVVIGGEFPSVNGTATAGSRALRRPGDRTEQAGAATVPRRLAGEAELLRRRPGADQLERQLGP